MSNSNEWPAVWCLCSIGLCLPIIKRPIRDYPFIVTHYWRIGAALRRKAGLATASVPACE